MKKLLSLILLFFPLWLTAQTEITSPNKKISVKVSVGNNGVNYSVSYDNTLIMSGCKAALSGKDFAAKYALKKWKPTLKTEKITSPFYRFSEFEVCYNEQKLTLSSNLGIVFRVFDDGVAYRFVYTGKTVTEVENEVATFSFAEDCNSWLSFTTNDKDPFAMAFQNIYTFKKLSEQDAKLSFLPVVADCGKVKATITESDLEHFPGMFLKADGKKLQAEFARYPKKFDKYPWRGMSYVSERENFIAKINPTDNLPWRIISLTENDVQMPVSNLVYALNSPNRIGSTDWIVSGKSAWDWWNDWNIKGVDFQAGINTETYKYFIDFAASHSLEYIILDEGWYDSKTADIMNPIADINLSELITYANDRGVGVVLWAVFNVVDENLNNGQLTIDNGQLNDVFAHYSKMGVKGFKIDFLDRNDQTAVEMAYRIAKKAAENHLVLDYHGFYPPTGMNRAFPNIINFESVFGMEEMKWNDDKKDMPLYDVTFPFIRMMCGPVDYTPGAMRNGTKHWYAPIYGNPMSMGTRCHQLACYVVHDSPFTMLADAPSAYLAEESYADFLSKIPNNPDFTKILSGKIGEHIVAARRFGADWYVGGLTNWDERDLTVDFSFLDSNANYDVVLYHDGKNANHNAEDYAVEKFSANCRDSRKIHLASGGGFVMKVTKNITVSSSPTAIPPDKNFNKNFYKKYLNVCSIPTISSANVSDSALVKTQEIISIMLAKRPDIRRKMIEKGCYTMVWGRDEQVCDLPEYAHFCNCDDSIKYWNWRARGFGGAPQHDVSASFGEENVLALKNDRYCGENIPVHEFSHLIHLVGIEGVEPAYRHRLTECYNNAKKQNLWAGTYALTDIYEYFAEGVQSFFNCNQYALPANSVHNAVNRREKLKIHDTKLYNLLKEFFYETDIPIYNGIHR